MNKRPLILLSLASKQIWPQVLTVAHLKPEQLILLHSEDAAESKGPAQRLKRFFDHSGLVPKGGTRMVLVSDSDFNAVEESLDELQRVQQLPLEDCVVNITGGNKLMATAAFRWAARHTRAFYLERRNQLTWFTTPDGRMMTHSEQLNSNLIDGLDPVALLRCQLDASEVERNGQTLTLNETGQKLTSEELFTHFLNGQDPLSWLSIEGEADHRKNQGDRLEFAAAAILLSLGVKQVQRSLRLKVKSSLQTGTRDPHAEIDLLFIWNGRLWLVDCKDRISTDDLVDRLRKNLAQPLNTNSNEILDRIQKELSISQTKVMKEDLIAIREAGGLLGSVVCVRNVQMPEEVVQYAKHNKISMVQKDEMLDQFRTLLFPGLPARNDDLQSLTQYFKK